MRNYIFLLFISITVTINNTGCAKQTQMTFKKSNQYFLEKTIDKLDIAKAVKGKIPRRSKISLMSLEKNQTLDKPIIAMIEDQMIQSLVKSGFIVLERDQNAIQRLVQEGTKNYNLTYNQSTKGIKFDKLTSNMINPGIKFVPTKLSSSNYIIFYRILESGILYKKDIEKDNSEFKKREGLVRLHIRVQNSKTGRIKYAANLNGQLEDKIKKELVPSLASFHYSLFPYSYPLQPKEYVSVKEIKTVNKSLKTFSISPMLGLSNHGLGAGFSLGYDSNSWGAIKLNMTFLSSETGSIYGYYENKYENIYLSVGLIQGTFREEIDYPYNRSDEREYGGLSLSASYKFPISSKLNIKPIIYLNESPTVGVYIEYF